MSYAGLLGLGDVVLGIPIASGSSANQELPNLFGDYSNHPLSLYMRAVMPGAFGLANLSAFPAAVKLAMLAMQYQGQPVDVLSVAAHSIAAENADDIARESGSFPQSALWNTLTLSILQSLVRTAVADVAAMPKPTSQPPQIKLNFGAVGKELVACVKAGGTWKNNTCTTTRKGVQWSHQLVAFVPIVAAPAPPATSTPIAQAPSTSHLGLYIGIAAGVVAIGTVGYLATRKRAA